MLGRRHPPVPKELIKEIDTALSWLDRAQARLKRLTAHPASIPERRQAHAEVGLAFQAADRALRRATALVSQPTSTDQQHSYLEWSHWRKRLSRLDLERQAHMLAEQDDMGVLFPSSVRTVDNGMSGPDIGDLQHGESLPPGTPARYGLDMDAVLASVPRPALPQGVTPPALGS